MTDMSALSRRKVLTGAAQALMLAGAAGANAQIGGRSGRLIWPYPPGGSADALARVLAEALSRELAQPFIVENRAGAGGRTGVAAAAAAPPDGQTILLATVALMSVFPIVYPSLNYDPFRDFEPISHLARFDIALLVGPAVPAASLRELVSWVKANPNRAAYSTPAAGSLPHFFATSFASNAGVDLVYVPYTGAPPALNDLVAGQLPMAVVATADAAELHKAGKARILATSGVERSILVPDRPTFREEGYAIDGYGWYGLFAPAGVDRSVVERYGRVVQKLVADPELKKRMQVFGVEPTGWGPDVMRDVMRQDFERWKPVVAASGFKPAQ